MKGRTACFSFSYKPGAINFQICSKINGKVIEIDMKSNKTNDTKKISLQSGMQADVSIIGEKRTILSYVINPISKLSKTALRD